MIKFLKKNIKNYLEKLLGLDKYLSKQNQIKLLLGNILEKNNNLTDINKAEFKVFSQFGEDGIIDFIIKNISLKNKVFLEIGTENYEEANTRFLLENGHWSGLIIDGEKEHINYIKKQDYYWKYDLNVINNFVTIENINNLIKNYKDYKNISLLSIDIDGNDYWLWKEINIDPAIVVIEYNSRYGKDRSVTIPYKSDFIRPKFGKKKIYYGASLQALNKLGTSKGYSLVATNVAGNNAFFVKKNCLSKVLKEQSVNNCYTENKFSEILNKNNEIEKYSVNEEKEYLLSLPLEEV